MHHGPTRYHPCEPGCICGCQFERRTDQSRIGVRFTGGSGPKIDAQRNSSAMNELGKIAGRETQRLGAAAASLRRQSVEDDAE